MRRTLALALGLVLALLLTACGGDGDAGARFSGRVLEDPYDVPDIALTSTEGEEFSLAADTDRPLTMVFFGYTHCPDICPMVLSSLSSALTRLDEADRDRVQVVVVTTDPARDDAETLRRYLDGFDPTWTGLTGDLQRIIDLGRPMAIYVNDGEKLPTGGYDLGSHTSKVVGIDGSDQAAVFWDETTSSAQFAADIHTLLNED